MENKLYRIFTGELKSEFPIPLRIYEESGVSRRDLSLYLLQCECLRSAALTASSVHAGAYSGVKAIYQDEKFYLVMDNICDNTAKALCDLSGIECDKDIFNRFGNVMRIIARLHMNPWPRTGRKSRFYTSEYDQAIGDHVEFEDCAPFGIAFTLNSDEFRGEIEKAFMESIIYPERNNKLVFCIDIASDEDIKEWSKFGFTDRYSIEAAKMISGIEQRYRSDFIECKIRTLENKSLDLYVVLSRSEDSVFEDAESIPYDVRSHGYKAWKEQLEKYKMLLEEQEDTEDNISAWRKIEKIKDKIPYNARNSIRASDIEHGCIYLYYTEPKCIKEHKTIPVTVRLPLSNDHEKVFNATYCVDCDKIFIFYAQIEAIQSQLKCVLDFPVKCDEWSNEPLNTSRFQKESKLAFYGYHVGQSGLGTEERQALLKTLIDKNLMSKQEIISWISSLLRWRGNFPNMEYARGDWQEDIEFLNRYGLAGQVEVHTNKIKRS